MAEQSKAAAREEYRQDILNSWTNPKEHEDGGITSGDSLAYPNRLFICSQYGDKVNRSFGRFTDAPVIDTDIEEWSSVWNEGQSLDEYEEAYNSSLAKYKEESRASPWKSGSALEIRNNGDFTIMHSDILRSYGSGFAQFLQREDNGRFLRFTFRVRDLGIKVTYNNRDLKGRIAGLTIRRGLGQRTEALGIDGEVEKLDMTFTGEGATPRIHKRKRTDEFGNVSYDGDPIEIKDNREDMVMGRKVFIDNRLKTVYLMVYKFNHPDIVDFEVEIPKRQELEKLIDHNGEEVERFVVESIWIPDELRRRPFQKPGEYDDMWLYADLVGDIGIDVKKNVKLQ